MERITTSQPPYFQYNTQDSSLTSEVNHLGSIGHIRHYSVRSSVVFTKCQNGQKFIQSSVAFTLIHYMTVKTRQNIIFKQTALVYYE